MSYAQRMDEPSVDGEAPRANDTVVGGVAAGLLAGAAMMAWSMATAPIDDFPWTRPLAIVGGMFVEGDGRDGGILVLLYGAVVWAAVSALLGLIFTALLPRDFTFGPAAILGIGYALVVLALMSAIALPRVNPTMRALMPDRGGAWVLAYVVFGVGLGLAPGLRRRLAARSRRPA